MNTHSSRGHFHASLVARASRFDTLTETPLDISDDPASAELTTFYATSAAMSYAGPSQTITIDGADYVLTFGDEFNGSTVSFWNGYGNGGLWATSFSGGFLEASSSESIRAAPGQDPVEKRSPKRHPKWPETAAV